MKNKDRNLKRNYFLVFIIIAASGIPFFSGIDFIEISLFLFSLILFIYNKENKDSNAFLIIGLFFLIELFQHFLHGSYSYRTSVGTAIKLATVYFVVKLVKYNFINYYINILYFFTVISLIFYTLSFLPGFTDLMIGQIAPLFESPFVDPNAFYEQSPSIIVFTFELSLLTEFRNSGPFWEPGAFAVFLIFAILFNIIKTKSLIDKKNKFFIVALITTFSTAGYIAFFILVSGYYLMNKKVSHKLLLILFVFASISIYTTTSFLEEKVKHNISLADETTSSRFGSALADYNLFKQSPLFGWGRGPMRYGGQKIIFFGKDQHRNNGVFVQLATYGILGSLLYFYLFYKSIFRINKYYNFIKGYSFVFFATIMTLGFSQSLFSKPFFLCFLFLFLAMKPMDKKILV
ncbi:O-antigen ligase family protein [Polaribacter marinivivus]|uniref:O-antigen ligase family protein n=1 Tax=Polaribacter marinivivus TaxID=1524260 RepID=A0ABV8REM3_9FLAO